MPSALVPRGPLRPRNANLYTAPYARTPFNHRDQPCTPWNHASVLREELQAKLVHAREEDFRAAGTIPSSLNVDNINKRFAAGTARCRAAWPTEVKSQKKFHQRTGSQERDGDGQPQTVTRPNRSPFTSAGKTRCLRFLNQRRAGTAQCRDLRAVWAPLGATPRPPLRRHPTSPGWNAHPRGHPSVPHPGRCPSIPSGTRGCRRFCLSLLFVNRLTFSDCSSSSTSFRFTMSRCDYIPTCRNSLNIAPVRH